MIWLVFGGTIAVLLAVVVFASKKSGRSEAISEMAQDIAKEAQEDEKIDATNFVDMPAARMRRKK